MCIRDSHVVLRQLGRVRGVLEAPRHVHLQSPAGERDRPGQGRLRGLVVFEQLSLVHSWRLRCLLGRRAAWALFGALVSRRPDSSALVLVA
eukprot:13110488-Alexandrium_andersonii.AAC.1